MRKPGRTVSFKIRRCNSAVPVFQKIHDEQAHDFFFARVGKGGHQDHGGEGVVVDARLSVFAGQGAVFIQKIHKQGRGDALVAVGKRVFKVWLSCARRSRLNE